MDTTFTAQPKSSMLKSALTGNVIFSTITGLLMIFDTVWLSPWMGIENPYILPIIGLGVLAWAYTIFRQIRKDNLTRSFARLIIAGDLVWVLASVVLLLGNFVDFTVGGKWLIAIAADLVLGFAVWQFFGLRRLENE